MFREYCDETGSKLRASDRRHEAHLGRFDDIDTLLEQIDKDISEVRIVMSENKDEIQTSLDDRASKLSSRLD